MPAKRYFRNYRLIEEPDGKGGTKKTLQYFGDYHYCGLEEDRKRFQGRLFLALSLIADVLYIIGVTRNIPGNRSGVSAAAGMSVMVPLFFMTLGSVHNLGHKMSLTENEYREARLYVRYGAIAATIVTGTTLLLHLVGMAFIRDEGKAMAYCLAFISFLAILIISLYVYRQEKNTPFSLIEGMGTGEEGQKREQHPYNAPVSETAAYHEGLRDYLKRQKKDE